MFRFAQRSISLLACVALFLIGNLGRAQIVTTASVNGTVVDSSGAVVPDAEVTLTDQATRAVTRTKTNVDGSYVAPALTAGTYNVVILKAGFQTFSAIGVMLHPATVTSVNATLSAGQVNDQVQVAANVAQVETSTAELSAQVSREQVETLPLNGRNYQSLSALMPGVTNISPGTGLSQGGFNTTNVMSINGMGTSGTMYYVDGIWNMNTGSMTQTTITPNPDTLQEVHVLQSNFASQYSLNSANVVLLQTKSGTASFHGTAFEYFRNDDLDARNFFSPKVSPRKQNIFGFNLGGPVFIPKYFNTGRRNTFFFWSEQWVRQHVGQALTGATPTEAMRQGIFAGSIKDPISGQPFPQVGGVTTIPANRLNPASVAVINALLPLPNNLAGGFNNYINTTPQINNQRDDQIKVDHSFSERLRITGEYFGSHSANLYPNEAVLNSPFNTVLNVRDTPNSLAQILATQILSSSMVNSTAISMNRYIAHLSGAGITKVSQIPGFNEVLPYSGGSAAGLIPQFTFAQGYSTVGLSRNVPQPAATDLEKTFSDDWSKLQGHHYFQAGVQIVLGTKRQTAFSQANGLWSFTGTYSGNAIADFLLGEAASFTQGSTRPRYYLHYRTISPYVQDRWKVTKTLTVTLGLRFLNTPTAHAQDNFESVFDPSKYDPAHAPVVTASGTILATPNYNPLNGLLINSVNGVPPNFTNAHNNYWAPSSGFAWDIFGDGKTSLRGGYGITYASNFNSTCAQSCNTNPPFVQTITLIQAPFPQPIGGSVSPAGASTLVSEDLKNVRDPMIQSFSLSLEHRFADNWFLSVAGAANIARHLPVSLNINQPLPVTPYDFNPAINAGSTFAYTFSPYQGYAAINSTNYIFNAVWDALELNLRHPMGKNLFLSAAYTWQHGLSQARGTSIFGAGSVQDANNPQREYGNSELNAPHIFTSSVIWTLPWFRDSSSFLRTVLGGWRYSDITTVQSGFSLSPGLSIARQGLATRPNSTGAPVGGPKTVNQWFNTAAFAAPSPGYFGNAGPGTIPGPGTINFDMALYKSLAVHEHHALEFRAEFFNVFNHTNFSAVSTAFGSANFGRVTAARDPRIIEGVLRYSF